MTAHTEKNGPAAVSPRKTLIEDIVITPVAFHDMPLLNSVGVHEPFALRSIVEVIIGNDIYGLGESYGDLAHLDRMKDAAIKIKGLEVHNTNAVYQAVVESLASDDSTGGDGMSGMVTGTSTAAKVFSPFEVACLDIQGKLAGIPVCDLLGGRVRDRVQYSAYLFYKWGGHPGQPDDEYGPALDPAGLIRQAHKIIDEYGFKAIKLKGGVFPPKQEVEAIKALRAEFPDLPLRIDPNAAWTVETSKWVAKELDGMLEYLEDPAPGIEGMAAVAKEANMPLATNMAVVSFAHLPPSIAQDAVQIVLSDHHFWGGLRQSKALASICATWGMRLSMHSNTHLGISLAASKQIPDTILSLLDEPIPRFSPRTFTHYVCPSFEVLWKLTTSFVVTHLASTTPNLDYACDTHWPWKRRDEDVIVAGALKWVDGGVEVTTAPGLGVELDRKKLAALHQQYLSCGLRKRDDTAYMKKYHPDFSSKIPRW
ncbi:hypothetical protein diail_584 [Diaporthe ilicicola]|nr:hypothetical protein diail_584 [Diaporthe ilicicola]